MVGQAGGQGQESKARPGQRRIALWTRDYARLPGIPDEYIGPDGAPWVTEGGQKPPDPKDSRIIGRAWGYIKVYYAHG